MDFGIDLKENFYSFFTGNLPCWCSETSAGYVLHYNNLLLSLKLIAFPLTSSGQCTNGTHHSVPFKKSI